MPKSKITEKEQTAKGSEETQDYSHVQVKLKPILGISPGIYLTILYSGLIILLLFWIFLSEGLSKSRRDFALTTNPPGASVHYNGEYLGVTPFLDSLPSEAGILLVEKNGFHTEEIRIDEGRQLFLLGTGWFAQKMELDLQLANPDEYLSNLIQGWSRQNRIGGFGQRVRLKDVWDPMTLEKSTITAPAGELFFPPFLDDLLLTMGEDVRTDSILLKELAVHLSSRVPFDSFLSFLKLEKPNWANMDRVYARIMETGFMDESSYPLYWYLENQGFSDLEIHHINFYENEIYSLLGLENLSMTNTSEDPGEYNLEERDTVLANRIRDFYRQGNFQEIEENYQERLERFTPVLPEIVGSRTLAGMEFTELSRSSLLLEDTNLGYFNALDGVSLAVSVPSFYIADRTLNKSDLQDFLETVDFEAYRDSSMPYQLGQMDSGFIEELNLTEPLTGVSFQIMEEYLRYLNEFYSDELGDFEVRVQTESQWLAGFKASEVNSKLIFDSSVWELTQDYYAESALYLASWGEEFQSPKYGWEKVVRNSAKPYQRGVFPSQWASPLIGARLVLVRKEDV